MAKSRKGGKSRIVSADAALRKPLRIPSKRSLRPTSAGHSPVLGTVPQSAAGHDPVSGPSVLDAVAQDARKKAPLIEQVMEGTRLKGQLGKNPNVAAVILAGGSGERLGRPEGKQVLEIYGKPVLAWSIESFDATPEIGLIVVVCPPNRVEEYKSRAIDPYPYLTPIEVVAGGEIRQESSFNGVEAVPDEFEFIAIHDGARPLAMPELISHVISSLKGNIDADGAVVGYPSIDTLKVVSAGSIVGTPDRSAFWNAQTPQVFKSDVIRQAHASALADGFVGTDDSSLVERIGGYVVLVQGPRDNIKVTVPEDIPSIAAVLKSRTIERLEESPEDVLISSIPASPAPGDSVSETEGAKEETLGQER